jgi:alpha-beta hydrolase superfamily lysophospholipase
MTWLSIVQLIILFIAVLYLGTCVGYFIFHRFFVLFPSRKLPVVPSDFHLQYEEVFFRTSDSVRLQGWLIKGEAPKEWKDITFVLFPGNKGTISDFLEPMSHLAKTGFNIFLFGYRGFGKSQKKRPTEKGVYKDSEGACRYLVKERGLSLENMVFLGQSLGCAMASFAVSRFCPRALILEGGFPSLVEVAARAVKWMPIRTLTTSRFETRKLLENVGCPVLIFHSRDDKAIPLSDVDILFDGVSTQKKKVIVSGPHAKGLEYDRVNVLKEIKEFLRSIR